MSKTKKILTAIILITVLLIGIGYAAIQNVTLYISGTATADPSQSNFSVKFTGTPEVSDSSKVTAAITDDTNATINVEGLTSSGETVTATYTVQNASTDLSADLSVETTNNNEEYFTIDAEFAKTSIVAGEATTLTVTVELLKTPINDTETSTIGIQMTATPVQPGEEGTTNAGSGNVSDTGLNEYGFYFNVPYSIVDGEDKYSYVFLEDGSILYYENEIKVDEIPEGSCVYAEKSITIEDATFQMSDDGTELNVYGDILIAESGVILLECGVWGHSEEDSLNHTAVGCIGGHFYCEDACGHTWEVPEGGTYTMISAVADGKTVYNTGEILPECYESQTGDSFVYGEYEYRYNQMFKPYSNEWEELKWGWSARVIDDTKTQYGEIYTDYINEEKVITLGYTFANCKSLSQVPTIPSGIQVLYETFLNCTSLIIPPEIPNGVVNVYGMFSGCTSLTTAPIFPEGIGTLLHTFQGCNNLKTYVGSQDADGDFSNYVIPSSVEQMGATFDGCVSLIKAPAIPANNTNMINTFYGCTSLTTAPIIPENVTWLQQTFYNCTSLTGTIQINTDKITHTNTNESGNGYQCFYGTTNPIVLKGTGSNQTTLQILAGTANNGNVTVE